MKKYLLYLLYILQHKKNFFKIAFKQGLYRQAFTHDNSKFSKHEFKAYANWFYGDYGVKLKGKELDDDTLVKYKEVKKEFDKAWEHHYNSNPHHWNFWLYDKEAECAMDMKYVYIMEMICDWSAMSLKFGDTPQKYYLSNYHKIILSPKTRLKVEEELGLNIVSGTTLYELILNEYNIWDEKFLSDLSKVVLKRYDFDINMLL